jgi:hypothetical protein
MLELADLLAEHSGLDQIFFANSGAEANEGAIKLARKWGQLHKSGAYEIITMDHGFHGRTLATMSASEPNLEQAQIYCVGEQLEHFFAARLGTPPKGLHWDAESLRLWLPIDAWMREFHAGETSQYLQISNWLDRYTHMRGLSLIPVMPEPLKLDLDIKGSAQRQSFPPQRKGLVCPYCTPEGRNIGRLLDIARGTTIKDGKLIRTDESPLNQLGFSASMVPFLEHAAKAIRSTIP